MRQQSIRVPLSDRRADLPGQRAPDAPPGPKAGRTAKGQISRLEAHICDGSPAKWGGHQDGLRDAGALLSGLHPGHLRPRDHGSTAGSGENHEQCPLQCFPTLNAPDSRMGQNMGQKTTTKIKRTEK